MQKTWSLLPCSVLLSFLFVTLLWISCYHSGELSFPCYGFIPLMELGLHQQKALSVGPTDAVSIGTKQLPAQMVHRVHRFSNRPLQEEIHLWQREVGRGITGHFRGGPEGIPEEEAVDLSRVVHIRSYPPLPLALLRLVPVIGPRRPIGHCGSAHLKP